LAVVSTPDLSLAVEFVSRAVQEREAYRDAEAFLRLLQNKEQVIGELDAALAERRGELARLAAAVDEKNQAVADAEKKAAEFMAAAAEKVSAAKAEIAECQAASKAEIAERQAAAQAELAAAEEKLETLNQNIKVAEATLADITERTAKAREAARAYVGDIV